MDALFFIGEGWSYFVLALAGGLLVGAIAGSRLAAKAKWLLIILYLGSSIAVAVLQVMLSRIVIAA